MGRTKLNTLRSTRCCGCEANRCLNLSTPFFCHSGAPFSPSSPLPPLVLLTVAYGFGTCLWYDILFITNLSLSLLFYFPPIDPVSQSTPLSIHETEKTVRTVLSEGFSLPPLTLAVQQEMAFLPCSSQCTGNNSTDRTVLWPDGAMPAAL